MELALYVFFFFFFCCLLAVFMLTILFLSSLLHIFGDVIKVNIIKVIKVYFVLLLLHKKFIIIIIECIT